MAARTRAIELRAGLPPEVFVGHLVEPATLFHNPVVELGLGQHEHLAVHVGVARAAELSAEDVMYPLGLELL